MTNFLIAVTNAMASAALAAVLNAFGIVALPVAALVGLAVFLLIGQTHAAILRRREKKLQQAIPFLALHDYWEQ